MKVRGQALSMSACKSSDLTWCYCKHIWVNVNAVFQSLLKALRQLSDKAVFRVLVKSVLLTALVFIGLGFGVYYALVWFFGSYFGESGGFAEAAAAVLLAALAFWFLFRVVALAVLQFFADEVVAAVEAQHYPARAMHARKLPFRRDLANSMKGVSRAIGFNLLALPIAGLLLVTGIGAAAVFLAVNAWLLGRELTDMAWFRHCGEDPAQNPVARHERLLLGGAIAGIMVVPGLNLLAPVIGAAAGTHLTHRAIDQSELEEGLDG